MLHDKHLKILEHHGEDTIKNLWHRWGYRKAADKLGISVGVLRTIVRNKAWKKPAKYVPVVLKAVKNGTASVDDFPHVSFDGVDMEDSSLEGIPFLINDDIEITVVQSISDTSTHFDTSLLLQINVNNSKQKED